MIRSHVFWEKEKEAPILNRNGNYITEENGEDICKRVEQFPELMKSYIKEDIDVTFEDKCEDKEILRIIELDAVRTFSSEENRKQLIKVLQSIYPITKDYHQGVSFISSFLLLFLKPEDVMKIVIGLHKYYLQGYFKAMPKAYVRDSRVFLQVLKHFHIPLFNHLKDLITPEAFVSKWFIGLNVHVLTFEALLLFFENLLKQGEQFLFKYSISLCKTLENEILKTKDVSRILALLRLDQKIFPNDYKESENQKEGEFFINIINNAIKIDISNIDLEKCRKEETEQMLIEEERRKQFELQRNMSDDEIIFSDEEEEEEDEEEEEEEEEKEIKDDKKKENKEEEEEQEKKKEKEKEKEKNELDSEKREDMNI